MKKSVKVILLVAVAASMVLAMMMFGGCGGGSSTPAAVATTGGSVVTAQAPFTGAANGCTNGGISVTSGIDKNNNGKLDADEAALGEVQYVCNGAPGSNGAAGASVTTAEEPAGINCANGGTKVSVAGGTPADTYVCNGLKGDKGDKGDDFVIAEKTVVRTAVEAFRGPDYTFIHGTNSPDGSKLFVVVNETNPGQGGVGSEMNGKFTAYLLPMSDVTSGKVSPLSIIAKNTFTGASGSTTIAFRQSYTPNGNKIVQAGKDRVVVLSGSNLSTLATTTDIAGGADLTFENHDALAIDNDYAILALQSKQSTTGVAAFLLYDLNTYQAVGPATNACTPCHSWTSSKSHMMCGIDGKLTKNIASGSTPTTYTGTIFVSSTSGGHLVKVPVTITPSNATPIVVGSDGASKVDISTDKGGTGPDIMPAYHDVRFDQSANRVYFSTIKTSTYPDATQDRALMGYVDLSNGDAVVKASVSATGPAKGSGLVYCGSGQTADYFIPMTMSYPAYIDAVKKSEITDGNNAINP